MHLRIDWQSTSSVTIDVVFAQQPTMLWDDYRSLAIDDDKADDVDEQKRNIMLIVLIYM